ncbi:MAG: sporulation transcriptional regulator SpoIIID [Clostridia bacterium]|nr:sporulation transcriptional regulator SpoIIID [Clostridia bacterium]
MTDEIEERVIQIARYMIETGDTVREVAKVFCISKSTVHKDITDRLEKINSVLAKEVKLVLEQNKNERHIRGGLATRKKYIKLKDIKLHKEAV